MGFYDLNKEQRLQLISKIHREILADINKGKNDYIKKYFSDEDTYIRKSAYHAIGKIYNQDKNFQTKILKLLDTFLESSNEKVRQTTINSAGEIGIKEFDSVQYFFDKGLFDEHHIVRNAVI